MISTISRGSVFSVDCPIRAFFTDLVEPFPPSVIFLGGRSRIYNPNQGTARSRFLLPVATSLTIEDSIISAGTGEGGQQVPLIRDDAGFSTPIQLTGVTFKGGSFAMLGASATNPDSFGGSVIDTSVNPNRFRDYTDDEISTHRISHSSFNISRSSFVGQSMSAIRLMYGALKVQNSEFVGTGKSSAVSELPVIDLRSNSPYDISSTPRNVFLNNSYSPLHASAFLRIPYSIYNSQTQFSGNTGSVAPVVFGETVSISSNPEVIPSGGTSLIAWSSQNVVRCKLYDESTNTVLSSSLSGSLTVGPLNAKGYYFLGCYDADDDFKSARAYVNIQ